MVHTLSLTAKELTVTRAGVPVSAGAGFVLSPGNALVIRGENGTGKTSILRAIAGFSALDRGTIMFLDESEECDADAVRATQIHWLGGEDGLADRLTVAETLAFWAHLFCAHSTDGAALLDEVRLNDKRQSQVGALSTGQRRRLGLLRLLLAPRALWLLDEPMSGLDESGRALVQQATAHHRQQGGIVLMATHDDGLPNAPTLHLRPIQAQEYSS
ncbi:MAG: heme ABC exporter ATP-binding protein CcmA [Pseudomonadota bacterium]